MSFSDIGALFRFKYLGSDFEALKAKHPYLATDQLFFDTLSWFVRHCPDAFTTPVYWINASEADFPWVNLYLKKTPVHSCVGYWLGHYHKTMEDRLRHNPDARTRQAFEAGHKYLWVCAKRIVDWERQKINRLRALKT